MGGLDGPVQLLPVGGKLIEIRFGGGRHGLDNVFQGIPVDPVPEVEEQNGDFRVGVKQRINLALLQVLTNRMIIGKIAVMHQGFVHAAKGMGAARMPDSTLGGIALMGDPDVRLESSPIDSSWPPVRRIPRF